MSHEEQTGLRIVSSLCVLWLISLHLGMKLLCGNELLGIVEGLPKRR